MNEPIYLQPIDWRKRPVFNLSVIAARQDTEGTMVERLYRCRVGAKTKNEAYKKLRTRYGFSWWIAEHAYCWRPGKPGISRVSGITDHVCGAEVPDFLAFGIYENQSISLFLDYCRHRTYAAYPLIAK